MILSFGWNRFAAALVFFLAWPLGSICSPNATLASGLPRQQSAEPVSADRAAALRTTLDNLVKQAGQSQSLTRFSVDLQSVPLNYQGLPLLPSQLLETIAAGLSQVSSPGARNPSEGLAEFASSQCELALRDSDANGKGALESSYRTAMALAGIADAMQDEQPAVAAKLYRASGQIARNLYTNPAYPVPARGGLAPLLIGEARGYELSREPDQSTRSISDALQWGLVEFNRVLEDRVLAESPKAESIFQAVRNRRDAYRAEITPGIQRAIAQFQSFPFDFSLNDPAGNRFTLSHFEGEFLVVDLWGTWCAPCRAAIPHLNDLQREYHERGLAVVGIALEQGDTAEQNRETLSRFLEANDVRYRCLLGQEQILEQLPNFQSYPTMLFIDRRGKVRFATGGYIDHTQLQVITDQLIDASDAPQ